MSKIFVLARLPDNVASLKIVELLKSLNIIHAVSEDVTFLHGLLNGDFLIPPSENIFEYKIGEEERQLLQLLKEDENDTNPVKEEVVGEENPVKEEIVEDVQPTRRNFSFDIIVKEEHIVTKDVVKKEPKEELVEDVQPKRKTFSFDIIVKEEHIVNKDVVRKEPKEEPVDEEEQPLDAPTVENPAENGLDARPQYDFVDHIANAIPMDEEIPEDFENMDGSERNVNAPQIEPVNHPENDIPMDDDSEDVSDFNSVAPHVDSDSSNNDSDIDGTGSDESDESEDSEDSGDDDFEESDADCEEPPKKKTKAIQINKSGKRVLPPSFYENRRYCRSKCPVEKCGEEFPSANQLAMHMEQHPGQYAYRCDQCDRQFPRREGLKMHTRVHTKERAYSCKQCDKKFAYRSGLKIHVDTMHAKKKPFVCDQCERSFGRKHVLATHMKLHRRDTPYKCDFDGCEEAFHTEKDLDRHQRRHTSTIVCKECGWVALAKHHLIKHMRTIHKK